MTLSELERGETAVITAVRSPDTSMREKLHSRGLLPGVEVSLLQTGNPLVVGLEQSRWALNRDEARRIEVAPLNRRPVRRRRFFAALARR